MNLLLVICTGNTCRSPMGQAVLEKKIADLGKSHLYRVESGGLWPNEGQPASPNSVKAMNEIGIDITGHRAKQVREELLEEAERIFVMTTAHKQALVSAFPQLEPKIEVMGVSDPFGLDLDAYRSCRDDIIEFFSKIEL